MDAFSIGKIFNYRLYEYTVSVREVCPKNHNFSSQGLLQFVIVVFLDYTHLLFCQEMTDCPHD